MDTGLEYEGEAARKRFGVYWLRPALAALGFGLFTFLVISVPAEKERIELRSNLQQLRDENGKLQQQVRDLLPFARFGRAAESTQVSLGKPGDAGGWGRVLYDGSSGRGVVFVKNLEADGQRAFCWWFDVDRKRHPLAAIELTDGSGQASIQLGPDRTGSFFITLESLAGEPSEESEPVLEAAVY